MTWHARLRSLRFRLPLLLLSCCAVMGGGVSLLTLSQQERAFERAFAARRLDAAVELQGRTERAAERGELEAAQREFGELPADPEVRAAVFIAPDGHVLLTTRREWLGRPLDLARLGLQPDDAAAVAGAMDEARLSARAQSRFTADRLGFVVALPAALPREAGALQVERQALILMVFDLSLAKAINRFEVWRQHLLWGAVLLAGALVLGLAVHLFVTRRLEDLQRLIARFASGERIDDAPSRVTDEIGVIRRQFQEMALAMRAEMAERRQAGAALEASEERFRTAMQYSPIGLALLGPHGRPVAVNPRLCQILGRTEEEMLGVSFREITHPEDLDENVELHEGLLSGRLDAFEIEKRYLHKDGHVVCAQLNIAVVLRDGRPEYFVAQVQDITARKAAEDRLRRANRALRAISHCNQALVHATDEASLLDEICRVVVEDGGYHLAWVAFANGDEVAAVARAGEDHGFVDRAVALWRTPGAVPDALRDVVRRGDARVMPDVTAGESTAWTALALEHGVRSSAFFPLKEDGRPVGALIIGAAGTDAFDDQDLALLGEMAEDLGYGLQALRTRSRHRQAEQALAGKETLLRQLIKYTPAAVAMFDREMRYLEASDRWLTDYGLDGTALLGRCHYDVFPEVPQRWRDAHQRVLAGAVERCEEDPFPRANGTLDWLEWEIRPWHDADGSIGGMTMFTQLITDRKKRAAELRAMNERYARHESALALLTRCHVDSADHFLEVVQTVTEVVGRTLGVSRTSVWQVSGESALRCVDLYEWPGEAHTIAGDVSGGALDEYLRILNASDVLAVPDVLTDERMAHYASRYLVQSDVRSLLAVPIRTQGRFYALLGCSEVGQHRRWTPDEQTFVVAAANLVSSLFAQAERLRLEAQLRQATKLEGIGQLAGGVAHDFNNVLTVILGKAGRIAADPAAPAGVRAAAEDIADSGERAANLTRQLLAFSRQQAMQVREVELNRALRQMARMLDRLLGDDLTLTLDLAPAPVPVRADAGMVDQVVLNLAVNARDAMARGGHLRIATSIAHRPASGGASGAPAPYACVQVADTGAGISPEHLPHIFEPFFTTKDIGKGTGLGLATTYGIVQQHHGWIEVDSELGRGTTFSVFLPLADGASHAAVSASPGEARAALAVAGGETVLVVEDEEAVRDLIVEALDGYGYRVVGARSAPEALDLWRARDGAIDLVITDMVMPGGMDGLELAARLREERPAVRVVFISGYLADARRAELARDEDAVYLAKPFSLDALAQTVRQALDGAPPVAH